MKIAVITYCDNGNYGSELQAIAMKHMCDILGHTAEFCTIKAQNKLERMAEIFEDKIRALYNCLSNKEYCTIYREIKKNVKMQRSIEPEMRECIRLYVAQNVKLKRISRREFKKDVFDYYICGSDQIWSPLSLPLHYERYLSFIPAERKMAYAPSLGVDVLPEYYKRKIMPLIARFDRLSVRERQALEAIKECTGKTPELVLDPTLAVGREFWDELIEKHQAHITVKKPYVLCYFLGEITGESHKVIKQIAAEKSIVTLPFRCFTERFENALYYEANPIQFVELVKNAEFIITDSFHCACFSIIYEKPFFAVERCHPVALKQTSRIISLLDMLGLHSRYYQGSGSIEYAPPDYQKSRLVLTEMREKSISFFKDSLLAGFKYMYDNKRGAVVE